MIGRFSKLGSYHELMDIKDFAVVSFAGFLALAGYWVDKGAESISPLGFILIFASICINGLPIIFEAISGVLKKKVNVDELVSIAIVASLLAGEFLTAAVVSFVMVLGSLIEEATSESARKAIHALIKITPEEATLFKAGKEKKIPVKEVRVGDELVVKPGERIPVDGIIKNGMTSVDESSITGEPIPAEKKQGDSVFAGTLNQNGMIFIEASNVGDDTTLGKVIQLVTEAEAHRPVSVALIDRYAKWFTPIILACAAFAWIITGEAGRAITVLIVGCPCALILAAPTAIIATISRSAKAGILIKGGQYIEGVSTADTLLFDKTGTLTQGTPRVSNIMPAEGIEKKYLIKQAACVEKGSTHPFSRAVLDVAKEEEIHINAAEDVYTEIGVGVRGMVEGKQVAVGNASIVNGDLPISEEMAGKIDLLKKEGETPLFVMEDGRFLGLISVSDPVREESEKTVSALKKSQIQTVGILSGDHEASVRLVGEKVGATNMWAGLKPDDKLAILRKFQNAGNKIVYVGDGINDAPALAAADVGIAMGAKGTEVALETADIALMNDDISKLPFLITLSKRMVFVIKLNIAFGLIFNGLSVLISGMGLITPIMGAILHNFGSVLVVMSSASIGFFKQKD